VRSSSCLSRSVAAPTFGCKSLAPYGAAQSLAARSFLAVSSREAWPNRLPRLYPVHRDPRFKSLSIDQLSTLLKPLARPVRHRYAIC